MPYNDMEMATVLVLPVCILVVGVLIVVWVFPMCEGNVYGVLV